MGSGIGILQEATIVVAPPVVFGRMAVDTHIWAKLISELGTEGASDSHIEAQF